MLKVHKRTLKNVQKLGGGILPEVKVQAWNDSGVDWGVTCNGHTEYFKQKSWTMTRAMQFMAELWGEA